MNWPFKSDKGPTAAALEKLVGELAELVAAQGKRLDALEAHNGEHCRACSVRREQELLASRAQAEQAAAEAERQDLLRRATALGMLRIELRGRAPLIVPGLRHPANGCRVELDTRRNEWCARCDTFLDRTVGPILVDLPRDAWGAMLAKHPALREALDKGEISVAATPLDDAVRFLRRQDADAAQAAGHTRAAAPRPEFPAAHALHALAKGGA